MTKRKRDMEIAGPAGRDTLRAGAHLPPLQYKVLAAVVAHTALWGQLEDHVSQGRLAEIVYDVDLSEVKRWQRNKVAEALRALRDDHKLIEYDPPIGQGVKQLSRVRIPPSSRGDSRHSNPPSSSGGNTSSESPLSASSNPPSAGDGIPPRERSNRAAPVSDTDKNHHRRARTRARGGGVFENTNSKSNSKGGTEEDNETRVRRHLSADGYGKQIVNRVVELLYDGVRHPEKWADSKVGKVAEEVEAMNRRVERNLYRPPPMGRSRRLRSRLCHPRSGTRLWRNGID